MTDAQGHHGAPHGASRRTVAHPRTELEVRLFDRADDLPAAEWDGLAAAQPEALFFDRRFLRAGEAGAADSMRFHYALFITPDRAVGLGVFQVADFVGQPVGPLLERAPASVSFIARRLRLMQRSFRTRLIVCGNAFTSGEHGFAFAPEVTPDRAVIALLDAVAQVRRRQASPAASAVLFKDFGREATGHRVARRLRDHGFIDLETEPNMVLEVDPSWGDYEGYLESLASKYRVKANRAHAKSRDLVVRDLSAADLQACQGRMEALYESVLRRADYRLGRQRATAFSALRRELDDDLVLRGFYRGEQLVGFSSGVVCGTSLETQCVGFDYEQNRALSIYPRMLYDYLQVALQRGLRRVNYGRTASEIKSTLGAEPEAVSCYLRHEQRSVNRLLPLLARYINMPQSPLRRPFKRAYYEARRPAPLSVPA